MSTHFLLSCDLFLASITILLGYDDHADVIGMTVIPECVLAREAEICYVSISTVTDYDVWAEIPVSSKEIIEVLKKNVEMITNLISDMLPVIPNSRNNCECGNALEGAIV